MYSNYNRNLQPYANKLRHNFTKAEACLWKYILKASLMDGFQFRRQRPVLEYIADFMCIELKLIIEVDGITHEFEENYKKDITRQKCLEENGYTVLRFSDNDVLTNLEGVRLEIRRVIQDLKLKIN